MCWDRRCTNEIAIKCNHAQFMTFVETLVNGDGSHRRFHAIEKWPSISTTIFNIFNISTISTTKGDFPDQPDFKGGRPELRFPREWYPIFPQSLPTPVTCPSPTVRTELRTTLTSLHLTHPSVPSPSYSPVCVWRGWPGARATAAGCTAAAWSHRRRTRRQRRATPAPTPPARSWRPLADRR